MPLRTITLDNGTECSRNIINTHPDGEEFLPEDFSLLGDTAAGKEIYAALDRLVNSITASK